MKTYFKFLSNNLFYTFVTVFGFAVSLMFVFLITVYTTQELSVDSFQEKGDRIYFVANDDHFGAPYRQAYYLQNYSEDIEEIISMALTSRDQPVSVHNERFNTQTILVEDNFWNVFSFPVIEGRRDSVFADPNNAIISESFARRVFPGKDAIGQVIRFDKDVTVVVAGVMEDIRHSILPYADIVVSMEHLKTFEPNMYGTHGPATIAVLAKEGVDLSASNETLTARFESALWEYRNGSYKKAHFVPMQDIYFSDMHWRFEKGNQWFVSVLIAVGIIVLLFAVFNYINLTVAQSGFRAREMAMRKLLGAKPEETFIRLIGESVLLTLFSLLTGILLAFVFLPHVNLALGTQLALVEFFSLKNILLILSFGMALGIVSGIFPALLISDCKPIDVVKGVFRIKSKMIFSKVFIVIQNILTIVLIVASIVIHSQVKHLVDAPLGYNTKNILLMKIKFGNAEICSLVAELEKLPSVKNVALSRVDPFEPTYDQVVHDGRNIDFYYMEGDSIFFNILGFEILHEHHSTGASMNYLTEHAYQEFEMNDEATALPIYGWSVDGKIKNFKLGNILENKGATILVAKKKRGNFRTDRIWVEVQGNQEQALAQIQQVYEDMSELDFDGKYVEDIIKESFAPLLRLQQIILIFCGIAILISALGLIAISTYFIRQRKQEIALRKVLGSTNGELIFNLVKSFLTYVGIAFLIAVPIAFFFLRNWLDDFAYRITLNPLYFLLAGLLCFLVSLLAVFFQSFRAANANPVNAIKSE